MIKKIMILGASILQLPAITKAKEMGLLPVVVDMNPDAVGLKEDGIIKEIISTIDTPALLKAAKAHKIDGIMTLATDMPMRSVAAIAKEMGLIGISDETAIKATNKAAMRHALQQHHVPIPNFFRVETLNEYLEAVQSFHNPFIVKPADSSGSRGIFKIPDASDTELVMQAYHYSKQFSRSGELVVEDYMVGPEVSVETLSVDGVCHVIQITDKITTGAPHFVEMGHSQPSQLSDEICDKIREIAIAANHAIGIESGPSHTEMIVTAEGPKIVELGARLGGDCITTHLVPLSTGVNMVECCIRIALGEKIDVTPVYHKGSAIRYFHQKAGTVKAITGVEEAQNIPGVRQISIVHGAGEKITEIQSSGDRMGFVISQNDDAQCAVKSCEKALDTICVQIDPPDPVYAGIE